MSVIIEDCFEGEIFDDIENAKEFLLELLGYDTDLNDYKFIVKEEIKKNEF
tara:strand:+ start:658 stop:810 length:153 start_codon:yes stop_codon:yes gene_type:complete